MSQVSYRVTTYTEGTILTGPLTMSAALRQAEAWVGSNAIIQPIVHREKPDQNDGTTHHVGSRIREPSLDDGEEACTWLYKVQRVDQSLATQGS